MMRATIPPRRDPGRRQLIRPYPESRATVARASALASRGLPVHIGAMLHIAKLAVGIRDVAHLQQVQSARIATGVDLRHFTRNFPRRAPDVLDGGSLYWVIGGSMLARQRLLDITEAEWDDGTKCAALVLDPALVLLAGRPTKPFQGWRYLAAADAPADVVAAGAARGADDLPPALRRELQALGLL